jgi:hypothetical protein
VTVEALLMKRRKRALMHGKAKGVKTPLRRIPAPRAARIVSLIGCGSFTAPASRAAASVANKNKEEDMSKLSKMTGAVALALAGLGSTAMIGIATPAAAASGFQNTCSNITFAYVSGSQAAVNAMCLKADGSANGTSLVLQGIGNNNGNLVQSGGASTFQKSCGNIQITANAQGATLTALCRNSGGGSNATSLPLNNIGNNNGNLTY